MFKYITDFLNYQKYNLHRRARSNKMLLRLLPLNFATKVPPKVRNRDKADFATKVRKSSINRQNVNHEQL